MEFLETVKGWFAPVWDFFEPGLIAYAGDGTVISWMPLLIQFGVIALVLTILMRSIGAILIFTVVGVIIHVIVDVVMPMVRDSAPFTMPPFMADGGVNMTYVAYLAALAAGFFLAMIVLSIFKAMIFRGD